jgi:hypothetical protein
MAKKKPQMLKPNPPRSTKNPIQLDPEPVATEQSHVPQHVSPILVIKKSKKKPSKHKIHECSSSPPFVHQGVNNTIYYYEPPLFRDDSSISLRLERKDRRIDILKAKVKDLKVLDRYIKSENATLRDRCAQL